MAGIVSIEPGPSLCTEAAAAICFDMPPLNDPRTQLRASIYFIQGEDVGRAGGVSRDCRYFKGSIAFTEWMAGFREGCAAHFDLTDEMRIPLP